MEAKMNSTEILKQQDYVHLKDTEHGKYYMLVRYKFSQGITSYKEPCWVGCIIQSRHSDPWIYGILVKQSPGGFFGSFLIGQDLEILAEPEALLVEINPAEYGIHN